MTSVTFIFNWNNKRKSKIVASGKDYSKISVFICGPNLPSVTREYDKACIGIASMFGDYFPGKVIGRRNYVGVCKFEEYHCRALATYMQKKCLSVPMSPSGEMLAMLCDDNCIGCGIHIKRVIEIFKYGDVGGSGRL